MSQPHQRDCEGLGGSYWHLQDAVDRAGVASTNAKERNDAISSADAATQYVAEVNPGEVTEQTKFLHYLNGELEKPRINPGFAFMAGSLDAEMKGWLLHHCPSELVWGIPSKAYATALGECTALAPELRRFESNTTRLMASAQTDRGK
jgi:hypothetical protein